MAVEQRAFFEIGTVPDDDQRLDQPDFFDGGNDLAIIHCLLGFFASGIERADLFEWQSNEVFLKRHADRFNASGSRHLMSPVRSVRWMRGRVRSRLGNR